MASIRLLCLFNGKASGWSKTLARTGCRNFCSSPSKLQSMSAWVIDQYGSSGVLRHTEEITVPTINFAHEVMIKVSAASLNPLDLNMRGGYGSTLLNLRRDPLSVMNSFSEFPLILGRDLSGVVVDCGSGVTHFAAGDELLKAWGAHVTVTCSQNAEGLVRGLGADEVVDYTAGDVGEQLEVMERFDVILDNVGGDTEEWAMRLLKPWSGAKYVTLVSPLLLNTDSMGLLDGTFHAGVTLHNKAFQNITSNGVFYRWAFYTPDGPTLDDVSRLVDAGKILPVVEAQFPFTQVPQAFQKLEQGHARGKTVVKVAEDDGCIETAESEQEVQETAQQN
ncbi:reticulon-4-interacting protein 1 homolog, mitochondrial-like isoform 2-T2 [Anableps anableps]